MKADISKEEIEARIKQLEPWRYNHSFKDITIRSSTAPAKAHDQYGKDMMKHILTRLIGDKNPAEMRALDLGCLEGHYSDILCSLGFKEVVAIDLSEGHVERAKFLLKELKGYENATVLLGNVNDENLMKPLGKFNIVLFHGLLYHLKDPLKIFDLFESLSRKTRIFIYCFRPITRCPITW